MKTFWKTDPGERAVEKLSLLLSCGLQISEGQLSTQVPELQDPCPNPHTLHTQLTEIVICAELNTPTVDKG